MKILDPIHRYIEFDDEEQKLIHHPVFQRLRRIKQLGFTEYSFPSASNSRFTHSLGVCHLAGRAFDHIFDGKKEVPEKEKKQWRKTLRAAALLHDIGHGPLSHSSEAKMPPLSRLFSLTEGQRDRKACHEDYSIWLIQKSSIGDLLKKTGIAPEAVLSLIACRPSSYFTLKGIHYQPVLEQILHSEIDVDRMDYLKRDSYFCGAYYGYVDFEWILKNLTFTIEEGRAFLAVKQTALWAVEDFLLGHHHMHLVVYYHRRNVIYDEMLSRYFKDSECSFEFPKSAQEYLFFNDDKLYDCLRQDASKIKWAERIIENKPLHRVFQNQYAKKDKEKSEKKTKLAAEALKKEGLFFVPVQKISRIAWTSEENQNPKIYVLSSDLKKKKTLEESMRLFKTPERVIYIDYLYADKEDVEGAQSLAALRPS